MAEAVLYNVATEVLKKLGCVAVQEIGLVLGVEDELHKLTNTVSTIRAVILDAEEQQATNHEVRDWLEKLNDAIYDADDLLDDFSTEVLRRKVMTQDKRAKKVRVFFSSSNQLAFKLKMGHQVKAIIESLDAVAADSTKFHFIERLVEPRVRMTREREETHSFVRAEEVIGRDDDKRAIVQLLLDSNVEENVSIIPIVGIGGLGKTALAQLVYNDELVKKHFELKMWVCVSDVFDVKFIVEKIIESATDKKPEDLQMDRMQDHLRKEIDGKKYLLVLDDVWNEDRERWLKLKDLLMGGARGSKILVTTRARLVATITSSIPPYLLKGLPDNESWSLFKQRAFKQGQEPENPCLLAIGKEIVGKCAGVPLAIRTLGSLLYSKHTEAEWLCFKKYDIPKIAQEENVILPILKLSYSYLPPYLKQCFAFCSLYLKDHEIDKQELIQLWIAHGFIQPLDENQHFEDIGDLYFLDLLRRSLFQDVKKDKWGNIISCKMHDLIHDLAQSVARIESFIVNINAKNVPPQIRHVSFDYSINEWKIPTNFLRADKIRTFLLPVQRVPSWRPGKSYEMFLSSFKRLRVLDLHALRMERLPSCISRLNHLRYLDLSGNGCMTTLPSFMTKLQNLQTLKLSGCWSLKELPRDIRKLVSLRHLELDDCYNLTHMPHGLGQLTSLRTLNRFILGRDSGISKLSGGLSELKGLNNLRGDLTIEGLRRGCRETTTEEANYLKGKEYLQSLSLEFSYGDDDDDDDKLMLKGLQPHSNLKELSIRGYKGVSFPTWMMVNIGLCLPNLVKITIKSCNRCQRLPQFGQLPSLQFLTLDAMPSVEYIDDCSDGGSFSWSSSTGGGGFFSAVFFPSLKEIELYELPNLKGWWRREVVPTATASFPCLSKSTIENCPNLTSMPLHPCVEDLWLWGVSEKLVQQQLTMMATVATTTTSSSSCSSSLVPLSKLKYLRINEIHDLVSLPEEGFQSLTSLRSLEIISCGNFTTLPESIGNLTSLEQLNIYFCPKLTSLPQGMHRLTALQELRIDDCSTELYDRCQKETGEDWPKIAHIAKVSVQ